MRFVPPVRGLGRAACLVLLAGPVAAQEPLRLDLPKLDAATLDLSASATSLPRPRAEPRTRGLDACPEQGAGFVRLPGSRTCLRLTGRAAAGLDVQADRQGATARPDATGRIAVDARTQTDLGPVRAFVRVGAGHR